MNLGLLGPNAVQSFHLAGGDAGTARTIAAIRDLVARGKRDIEVNRLAIGIVWPTPQFSETEKAQAIFNWVQQNTRFIPMIVGAQTLRTAREILRVSAGDCSNLNAVLIPSMLETIGIRSRLVTVASDAEAPDEFTHVYAEAFVDGQWVPMDVARPGAYFGRAPEQTFRQRIWDLESPRFRDVPGLSGLLAYGHRGRGMGDFNWSALTSAIPGIETGTAQIVSAARANPGNLFASSVPAGTVGTTPVATAGVTAFGVSPTILVLALAAIAIIMVKR